MHDTTYNRSGLPAELTAKLRRMLIIAIAPTAFLCGYVIADDARIEREQRIARINATHEQLARELEQVANQCAGASYGQARI